MNIKTYQKNIITSFHNNPILFSLTIVFAGLSLAYLSKGFYTLAFDNSPSGARDLLERWKEQQYIYQGIYPYRMDASDIDTNLGRIRSGGYPPWAFFTGFFIFPPLSWPLLRFYHVFLNLISLGILSIFSYQLGIKFGQTPAYFFVVSTLALGSHCTTLNNGQYGIIINALLIGLYWLIENKKNYLSGVLMGMAMAKPSISAPYILSLIVRRNIRSLATMITYIILGTFTIAWVTSREVTWVLERFIRQIKYVADDGSSGINILIRLGINPNITLILLSVIALAISFFIIQKLQHLSLLTLFAAASVIGRVFTYHRSYDDVMLVFLWLALLYLIFSRLYHWDIIITGLVGLTLWIPLSIQNMLNPYFSTFQSIIWLVALSYLLYRNSVGKSNHSLS
ncbi:MAG: glycosyltransferase family 87 protein [Microcystaceae cyanobacterium]